MTDAEILKRIVFEGGEIVESLSEDNWLARVEFNPMLVAQMLEVAYQNGVKEQATRSVGEARKAERAAQYQVDALIRHYGGEA